MFASIRHALLCGLAFFAGANAFAETLLVEKATPADFPLVDAATAAPIFYSDTDAKVVSIAARNLAADIERVTGKRPSVSSVKTPLVNVANAPVALIGTIGQSPLINALVASGKLDVSKIKGQWESFLIVTLDPRTLVIAGSDPRGTAFGVYELSQAIGVSPWYWWADVTPTKRATLAIAAGEHRYGPPSVKYRGIFISDEDWGLQPWAAKTFEPKNKGIGPKTYEKVFELLLRLKANTLWPAMRKGTPPFNSNPANAALAADYAIVMGSSPAEPMLRNNNGEWNAPAESFNYTIGRDDVLAYWEERVKANARYENSYTLGMGDMQPSGTVEDGVARLEKIFADQRALIAKYTTTPDAPAGSAEIPLGGRREAPPKPLKPPSGNLALPDATAPTPSSQLFCINEQVFDLIRGGLRIPDDVTVMFTDDGFGYIRNFPTAAKRAGGYGIYYHISYLGAPLSYLWLCTTPPALIWEEMSKACALGADRMWILNVGDIKPAEIDIEFFLQMAWDIRRWNTDTLPNFLPEWAAREFGPAYAAPIGALMEQYYTYNFARRPEHLQWWLPGEPLVPSALSPADRELRRDTGITLTGKLGGLRDRIPAEKQDAFYELVDYPVQGAVLANNRYFTGETAALKALSGDHAALDKLGNLGDVLNGQLARITHRYNMLTAAAKWNGIMQLEPADDQYKTVRISAWRVPAFKRPLPPEIKPPLAIAQIDTITPGKNQNNNATWRPIRGLGQTGNACALLPANAPAIPPERAASDASVLVFSYTLANAPRDGATVIARIHILPTHASDNSGKYRFAYAFDAAPSSASALQFIERSINDGGPAWEQGVLSNERIIIIALPPAARTAGEHKLNLYGLAPGMVVDRVTIE